MKEYEVYLIRNEQYETFGTYNEALEYATSLQEPCQIRMFSGSILEMDYGIASYHRAIYHK